VRAHRLELGALGAHLTIINCSPALDDFEVNAPMAGVVTSEIAIFEQIPEEMTACGVVDLFVSTHLVSVSWCARLLSEGSIEL
jgi:hypothetical protein